MKNTYIILLTIIALQVKGQISITGKIIDENKQPFHYVNISAFSEDSTYLKGQVSDENGNFILVLNEQNQGYIKTEYLGYKPLFTAFNGTTNVGTLELSPDAVLLDGVTITEQAPLVIRQQDKLVVNVAQSVLSQGNSTLELLQKSPGVIVDQNDDISICLLYTSPSPRDS